MINENKPYRFFRVLAIFFQFNNCMGRRVLQTNTPQNLLLMCLLILHSASVFSAVNLTYKKVRINGSNVSVTMKISQAPMGRFTSYLGGGVIMQAVKTGVPVHVRRE